MSTIIDAGENLMLERQASVAQTKTQGGRRLAQKRGPTLYNLEVEVPAQRMNSDVYYGIENEVITLEYGANDFESANITGKIGGSFTTPRGSWSGTPVANSPIADTGTTLFSNFPFNTDKLQFGLGVTATAFLSAVGIISGGTAPAGFNLRSGVGGTPQDFGGRTFTQAGNIITISGSIDQTLSSAGNLFWNIRSQGTSIAIDGATANVNNWARAFDYVQFAGSTKVYQVSEDANSDSSGNVTLKLNSPLVVSPGDNTAVTFGNDVSFNFAMMDRPATSYQPGNIVMYGTFKFEEVIRNQTRGE